MNRESPAFMYGECQDILIGFCTDGKQWRYSLRSDKVDASLIAMQFGGGGHRGAAGFASADFVL